MATLHEDLTNTFSKTGIADDDIDSVEGFKKDVKKKLSKFLCGISGIEQESPPSNPPIPPSPSVSSTSSRDFREAKTAFVAMETRLAAGDSDDSDVYAFNYTKRGLAVIINNEDFAGSSDFDNRPGSSYDASALYHSFAHLGFDVLLYQNLAAWKMVEVLKLASRDYDHINADCFACSILTHGDQTMSNREYDRLGVSVRQDLLFGTDGKAVSTRTIVDLFSDQASPGLRGKPRLFFLQACRGNKLDDGQHIHVVTPKLPGIRGRGGRDNTDSRSTAVSTDDLTVTDSGGTHNMQRQESTSSSVDPPGYPKVVDRTDAVRDPDDDVNIDVKSGMGGASVGNSKPAESGVSHNLSSVDAGGDPAQEPSSVDQGGLPWQRVRTLPVSPTPLYKDCLVMYATPPGHFAWRRKNGAWFIQSLCKVLDSRQIGSLSLLRALVRVSSYVAQFYQSENPSRPDMHAKKEMPVIESMLVKDVFLMPKKHS